VRVGAGRNGVSPISRYGCPKFARRRADRDRARQCRQRPRVAIGGAI